ncbi:MAG: DEAD/DEAH box helicase [Acidimicrobiales bacterium]
MAGAGEAASSSARRVRSSVRPGSQAKALLIEATRVRDLFAQLLRAPDDWRARALTALEQAREQLVQAQLRSTPVGQLKETTEGRLRLGPIEAARITTVAAVLAVETSRLRQIDGVGDKTAAQVVAAARQLESTLRQNVRVRFDPDVRRPTDTALLQALRQLELATQVVEPMAEELRELSRELSRAIEAAVPATNAWRHRFSSRRTRVANETALEALSTLMSRSEALIPRVMAALSLLDQPPLPPDEQWADYARRAATYNGLLIELAGYRPDVDAAQGHLPEEIAASVNAQPLDLTMLQVSLRGYQAFGAKFALVQRKAILGDEMGLGKTIEALAVMSHLDSEGNVHSLVVCPASVVVNWVHEIERHSRLVPHRLHGPGRNRNLARWIRDGGVAVTTFDVLRSLDPTEGPTPGLLVVDEAHYVKNPRALRTKALRAWVDRTDRVLYLTGTPMENRLEEFKSLVRHLQPELAERIDPIAGLAGASTFRAAVAPVYLRRNQEDVLDELPPKIETENWVAFSSDDLAAYRAAVAEGSFMAMRRAAFAPGTVSGSAKLARLCEIVDESVSNGHKIVVFSYFRDVLRIVCNALESTLGVSTVGPITGSVAATDRQRLVDEFTARSDPAVLVSQIEAGGVGLNIQSASVVVITEPQWKPTVEAQAIARCHRMGQIRPVDVHRLLVEDSVDERMLEILRGKDALFGAYVRESALKDAAVDAIDVSNVETTRGVVSRMEAERRIVELERKRLGIEPMSA